MSGAHEVSKARLKYPNGDRFSSCHKPSLMTMMIDCHTRVCNLVDLTSFGPKCVPRNLVFRRRGRSRYRWPPERGYTPELVKKVKALVLDQLGCRLPASTLERNKIRTFVRVPPSVQLDV